MKTAPSFRAMMAGPLMCLLASAGLALGQISTGQEWRTWTGEGKISPENIAAAKLVKGGNSPDGRFTLGEMFAGLTTETFIGIVTADKKQMLCMLPVHTQWQLDKPHTSYLTVLWSPDSRMVAVHDSLDKYSVLHVYREEDGKFAAMALPDMQGARESLLHPGEKLLSSAQMPVKWKSPLLLEVLFKASIGAKNGSKRTAEMKLLLMLPTDGKAVTIVSHDQ